MWDLSFWQGVGHREAVWQHRHIILTGPFLYLLEFSNAQTYKYCSRYCNGLTSYSGLLLSGSMRWLLYLIHNPVSILYCGAVLMRGLIVSECRSEKARGIGCILNYLHELTANSSIKHFMRNVRSPKGKQQESKKTFSSSCKTECHLQRI